MKTSLTLVLAGILLALPGFWLLLRQPTRWAMPAAVLLLLLATACTYTGIRLWLESTPLSSRFELASTTGRFQVISPAQLPEALTASRGRPVLLEFYADWCSSCVVWKTTVFNRSDVQEAMMPLVLLQIDASELTPDVQALLDQHGLVGLPAILVYDKNGQEHTDLRLLGEMGPADFIAWINTTLLPSLQAI